jgi:hypothetical protein
MERERERGREGRPKREREGESQRDVGGERKRILEETILGGSAKKHQHILARKVWTITCICPIEDNRIPIPHKVSEPDAIRQPSVCRWLSPTNLKIHRQVLLSTRRNVEGLAACPAQLVPHVALKQALVHLLAHIHLLGRVPPLYQRLLLPRQWHLLALLPSMIGNSPTGHEEHSGRSQGCGCGQRPRLVPWDLHPSLSTPSLLSGRTGQDDTEMPKSMSERASVCILCSGCSVCGI